MRAIFAQQPNIRLRLLELVARAGKMNFLVPAKIYAVSGSQTSFVFSDIGIVIWSRACLVARPDNIVELRDVQTV